MAMRNVKVTVEATGAWEVWGVQIPDDIADDEVEQYVKDNLSDLEKWLDESGADSYEITEVELA